MGSVLHRSNVQIVGSTRHSTLTATDTSHYHLSVTCKLVISPANCIYYISLTLLSHDSDINAHRYDDMQINFVLVGQVVVDEVGTAIAACSNRGSTNGMHKFELHTIRMRFKYNA